MITASEPKTYASDGGHFYMPDGSPFYEVESKSKPGTLRPATLRDARKVGALPSVTTITRTLAAPGLRRYLDRQIYEATFTTPRLPDETDDQHFARCLQWADEHSRNARDRGTAIHGAIEGRLMLLPTAPEMLPFIEAAQAALDDIGFCSPTNKSTEHSFAHPLGYGGKVDLHGPGYVVDFKTKANWTDPRKLAWPERAMQLAAYRHGLNMPAARCLNIFISTDDPGKYHVHEWPEADLKSGWRKFELLLRYWQEDNEYWPGR